MTKQENNSKLYIRVIIRKKMGKNMEELDLKDMFDIFWNKKAQIIVIVILFIVIGFIYTMNFVNPVFTSSTTLVLAQADKTEGKTGTSDSITATDITLNSKLVSTYSELIKSKNVLRTVLNNLNLEVKEEDLRRNIKITAVKDTELIQISVTNANSAYAAQIANEIANVFSQKVAEIYNINNINIVDEAEIMQEPSNINHKKDIIMFTFAGFVVAFVYVILVNILDTTVKTPAEIENLTKLPVLASIQLMNLKK